MPEEVFLEPVPDADISIARCSICKMEFHSSPVGPRKPMSEFPNHVKQQHPDAVRGRAPWELYRRSGK